ncbi:putative RIN4, pathogenic type III effector avirulence factor Avr cleavage [Dioscorea sansibarensis]
MDGGKEKGWTVPQFGGWNEKTGAPDYSMVFSLARANRKQQKTSDVVKKSSVANEEENAIRHQQDQRPNNDCPTKRRKLLSYLCLIPKAH